jgi:hypothetical protein
VKTLLLLLTAAATVPAAAETAIIFARPSDGRMPRLQAGTPIEGVVERPVYAGSRLVIPAGSVIHTRIDSPVRAPRAKGAKATLSRIWEFIWNPSGENKVRIRAATLSASTWAAPGGSPVAADLSLADAFKVRDLRPKGSHSLRAPDHPRMVFELRDVPASSAVQPEKPAQSSELAAGSSAKLVLLSRLSGSTAHTGSTFSAMLAEPIPLPGGEVAAGTRFDGRVLASSPARRLRRPGKLHIGFNGMTLPAGTVETSTTLTGVEMANAGHVSLSSEGALSGGPVGWKANVADLSVSYVVGKVTDDLVEEGIKAVMSSVTATGAANAARYFGFAAGLAWFFAHRGREAVLPQYTLLDVTLNRPVLVPATAERDRSH